MSHVAQEDVPGGQLRGVLSFKSIRQIEAIERLMQVVEHRSDVGARFNGGKSEGVMTFEGIRPHRSTRDIFLEKKTNAWNRWRGCHDF